VAHWRGQQSLAWSFWVNLVALRILVFMLQATAGPNQWYGDNTSRLLIMSALVIFHGLLLVWQIVGVVRSAERHFAERGNMALVWGAQLGAVLFFVLSIIYTLEAIQITMLSPPMQDPIALMKLEHAAHYTLSIDTTQRQLTIDGSIELGISRAVNQFIHDHPSVTQINLNSAGGNIYAARGLAKLFRTLKLDTHIMQSCASACTTAFIGGLNRSSAPDASIGFHQYRMDAEYSIVVTDVQKEQARDAVLFLDAGVSEEFVGAMYDRVPNDMWWPSAQELLQAGFIHELR